MTKKDEKYLGDFAFARMVAFFQLQCRKADMFTNDLFSNNHIKAMTSGYDHNEGINADRAVIRITEDLIDKVIGKGVHWLCDRLFIMALNNVNIVLDNLLGKESRFHHLIEIKGFRKMVCDTYEEQVAARLNAVNRQMQFKVRYRHNFVALDALLEMVFGVATIKILAEIFHSEVSEKYGGTSRSPVLKRTVEKIKSVTDIFSKLRTFNDKFTEADVIEGGHMSCPHIACPMTTLLSDSDDFLSDSTGTQSGKELDLGASTASAESKMKRDEDAAPFVPPHSSMHHFTPGTRHALKLVPQGSSSSGQG
uniref:Uncharacterized protein n=1 Tax=Chromera velia CCMP2878 TaxID=1169474 RepID=A0A0G4F7K3_9ALVE|eukprot:Cvel_15558.t1-p1 / transcript=Cvel_15558.t1 / gene=Cvel_15558 / organism=Chromera_velia_CCMP2878 / gene_product=hypothetical protein / transcript_product=hypothetical protein / location=Cvel_scaffold1156:37485-40050(+) / protein_length=307 / sequence_SO=supercontig / SO=protein_coding / is_pseudo=false